MAQLNRDELIEKIARTLAEVHHHDISNAINKTEGYVEDHWEEFIYPAEQVLKALGEYLPDVIEYHNQIYKDSAIRFECGSTAYDLYTQLKNMCEGK
jgi:hypothetical protein